MGTKADFEAAYELVASGRARPVVDEVLPLAEIRAAHERLEAGEQLGKIVLTSRNPNRGPQRCNQCIPRRCSPGRDRESARNMSLAAVHCSCARDRRAASASLLDLSPGNGMALDVDGRLRIACAKSARGINRAKSRPRKALRAQQIALQSRDFCRPLVRSLLRRGPIFPACHRVLMSKLRFKCVLTGTATTISTWSSNVQPADGSRRCANTYGTKVAATADATSTQITR